MQDWRRPGARIRTGLKNVAFRGFSLTGHLQRLSARELAVVPCDTVPFYGHRIGRPGPPALHHETRLGFREARPAFEEVADLSYSPAGRARVAGQLTERYSLGPLRLQDLLSPPSETGAAKISSAVIVECNQAYSYGDWVHCFLGTLLRTEYPDVPVLIPGVLAQKSYVRRDLDRAGITWQPVESTVRIAKAYVLRKPNPMFYWSADDVAAFRAAFAPDPPAPAPGSLAYLGRFGLQGETIERPFPGAAAAEYTRSRGGTVIAQADLTTQTAEGYAPFTETVIGDHGSGLLNMMFWRPRRLIELVVGDWWVNNNLFVAAAMGVEDIAVLRVDDLGAEEIGALIETCETWFDSRNRGPG